MIAAHSTTDVHAANITALDGEGSHHITDEQEGWRHEERTKCHNVQGYAVRVFD